MASKERTGAVVPMTLSSGGAAAVLYGMCTRLGDFEKSDEKEWANSFENNTYKQATLGLPKPLLIILFSMPTACNV
jgi:hypothetical protein